MKRIAKPALALALGTALSGCAFLKEATTYRPAATDSQETMKSELAAFHLPLLPDSGKAVVYVVRPSGLGALIGFDVFLDDHEPASEMGSTHGNQHIYFQVPPGEHTIYSKAENWAEARISPAAGETVFVQQRPSWGFVIARNSLSTVDATLGKYQVMQTSPGRILKTEKDGGAAPGAVSAGGPAAPASGPAAEPEEDIAMADWKSLPADKRVKIYSKSGTFTGKVIRSDGGYLWITQGDGKKAFSTFEIDRITAIK